MPRRLTSTAAERAALAPGWDIRSNWINSCGDDVAKLRITADACHPIRTAHKVEAHSLQRDSADRRTRAPSKSTSLERVGRLDQRTARVAERPGDTPSSWDQPRLASELANGPHMQALSDELARADTS